MNEIINFLSKKWCSYYPPINDPNSLEKIKKLILDNVPFEPINQIEKLYYGIYSLYVSKDYDDADKYFGALVIHGNPDGLYYYGILMKYKNGNYLYYFKMAAECNHIEGLIAYAQNTLDFNEKITYLEKAIKLGSIEAMYLLGLCYRGQCSEFKSFYEHWMYKAIDHGSYDAAYSLGSQYEKDEDYKNMIKYYIIGTKLGGDYGFNRLCHYYTNVSDINEYDEQFYQFLELENDLLVLPPILKLVKNIHYSKTKQNLEIEI